MNLNGGPETGSLYYRILIASFAAYCIANIAGWILPDLIHEFVSVKRLSESQAGLVGTVELAALALSSMLLARFVKRTSFLVISLVGTAVAIIATVLSIIAHDHGLILLLRGITGAGEGAALMVSSAALARFRDPDRAYGQMNVVNIVFGAGLIFLLPTIARYVGPNVAFPTLLAGLLILTPFLFVMPRNLALDMAASADRNVQLSHHDLSPRLYLLAATMFIVALNSSAVWSFLVLLGTRAGLDEASATRAVGIVAFVSVTGSLLATVLGVRFGRFWPTVVGIVSMTGCIVILCTQTDLLLFRICACLLVASVYFIIPYFMGYAAAEDSSGRGAALVGGAFLLTVAVSPYIAGLIIEHFGMGAIAAVTIVTNTAALVALSWFDRDLKQRPPADLAASAQA